MVMDEHMTGSLTGIKCGVKTKLSTYPVLSRIILDVGFLRFTPCLLRPQRDTRKDESWEYRPKQRQARCDGDDSSIGGSRLASAESGLSRSV
jgi:hypothetical protein